MNIYRELLDSIIELTCNTQFEVDTGISVSMEPHSSDEGGYNYKISYSNGDQYIYSSWEQCAHDVAMVSEKYNHLAMRLMWDALKKVDYGCYCLIPGSKTNNSYVLRLKYDGYDFIHVFEFYHYNDLGKKIVDNTVYSLESAVIHAMDKIS